MVELYYASQTVYMILNSYIEIIIPDSSPTNITTFTHQEVPSCYCAFSYFTFSKRHFFNNSKIKTIPIQV